MNNKWVRAGVGGLIFISPLFFQAHLAWLIITGLIGLNVVLTGSVVPCPMCSIANITSYASGKLCGKSQDPSGVKDLPE